jgi:hypothetical protein
MCGESGRSIRAVMGFDVYGGPAEGARGSRKVGSIYGVDFTCAISKSSSIEPAFSTTALMQQANQRLGIPACRSANEEKNINSYFLGAVEAH